MIYINLPSESPPALAPVTTTPRLIQPQMYSQLDECDRNCRHPRWPSSMSATEIADTLAGPAR